MLEWFFVLKLTAALRCIKLEITITIQTIIANGINIITAETPPQIFMTCTATTKTAIPTTSVPGTKDPANRLIKSPNSTSALNHPPPPLPKDDHVR